jgi:cytoskeletal protein CcmA (bactofilin family)
MWKKEDEPVEKIAPRVEAAPAPQRPAARPATSGERATIGRSITIRGDVTGDEDLLIQGRVDGSVNLREHAITVGPDGVVKASIVGRVVSIEGKVEGNISADEQIILRTSATVQGDISAPRVVLEDGAKFRGGVEMGEAAADRARASQLARGKPASEPADTRVAAGMAEANKGSGEAIKVRT